MHQPPIDTDIVEAINNTVGSTRSKLKSSKERKCQTYVKRNPIELKVYKGTIISAKRLSSINVSHDLHAVDTMFTQKKLRVE